MKNLGVRYDLRVDHVFNDLGPGNKSVPCHVSESGQLLFVAENKLNLVKEEQNVEVDLASHATGDCVRVIDLGDDTAVLGFQDGTLLLVDLAQGTLEEVGQVESGLEDVIRSPDDELFVLLTSAGSFVLTSREFDPLKEVSLHQSGFGEDEFVNVGWGKKETQFHGSAGKAASKAKPVQDPGGLTPFDDGRARLAWRDDGQFFAVSYITQGEQVSRKIRVFSRDGVLQATSEPCPGLEHCLAWKPTGALIASAERLPNKYQVSFFERNGLRHGEFTLPFEKDEAVVTDLSWNKDSEALMVVSKGLRETHPMHHFVQIWTMSNYHWSLKQSWVFEEELVHSQWDPVQSLRFYIVTRNGSFHTVELAQEIWQSPGRDECDQAWCAVVEGKLAKMTPFRRTVIPPPMAAFELRANDNIKQVVFNPDQADTLALLQSQAKELLVYGSVNEVIKSDKTVAVTGAGGEGFQVKSGAMELKSRLQLPLDPSRLTNLCWLTKDTLIASQSSPESALIVLKMESDDQVSLVEALPCEDAIYSIAPAKDGSVALCQLRSGLMLKFDLATLALMPFLLEDGTEMKSSNLFLQTEVVTQEDGVISVLGLTQRHRLYRNNLEICSGVTSFHVHSDFLLVTTSKHILKCLPLRALASLNDALWMDESVRAIERGATLVTAVTKSSKTILQMPRGNLEVIHPRAMVISIIRHSLDQSQFQEAFEVLRRHRVNLNLLFDHDPSRFLTMIATFVEQISDVSRLCLFIAELSPEDTTKTMYASSYRDQERPEKVVEDKVSTVAKALLSVFEGDMSKYLLPIISCHIKLSRPDTALQHIRLIKDHNVGLANQGLQFLLLLVDVQTLFDVALGMYDFDLVLFVAERSHKDPKEFVPFLNELRKLPEQYQKYKIDLHLKRYDTALEHLSRLEHSEYDQEVMDLVTSQRLFLPALTLFPSDSRRYKEICKVYGEYLVSKKYYEDAALILERSNLLKEASEAWEKALNWRFSLALAQRAGFSVLDTVALCQRLVQRLTDNQRFAEAAIIYKDHLDNVEEAVATLTSGRLWTEAYLLITKAQRPDLFETHFVPLITSHAEEAETNVERKAADFDRLLARLVVVLDTKQKMASGLYDEVDVNPEDGDLYSETTSTVAGPMSVSSSSGRKSNSASLKTRTTQRSKSSKNRRKQEKKKYSTREGSEYEDLGLISELHQIMTWAIKATEEVSELNKSLLMMGLSQAAKKIQGHLVTLIDRMRSSCSTVWPNQLASASVNSGVRFGPEATTADIIKDNTLNGEAYTPCWSLIEPHLRYPPNFPKDDEWQLRILCPQ